MSADTMLKTISDESVEYVDIRFTDPRGKLQHVTVGRSEEHTSELSHDQISYAVFCLKKKKKKQQQKKQKKQQKKNKK